MVITIKKSSLFAYMFTVCAMFYVAGCGTGTDGRNNSTAGNFTLEGLENREVYEIRESGNLFAGTSRGLVRFERTNGRLQVSRVFMEEAKVRTFVFIDENTWLISAVFANNSDSSNIYRTTDRGENWQMFNNGFGGDEKWVPAMMDNASTRPQIIFARTQGLSNVGRTMNAGQNWESVVSTWDNPNLTTNGFVKVDPNNPDIVWAGGANAFFSPRLIYTTNSGEEWSGFSVIERVETTVFDIISRSNETDRLLVGMRGFIRKSNDKGQTWETVFEGIGTRAMSQSIRDNDIVYASGITSSSKLFFAASFNFGDSWELVEFEEGPNNIVVNDMLSVMENDTEVLYFATNQGLYSFTFDQ